MTTVVGSAAFGLAMFIMMVGTVEPLLARRWVRGRLVAATTTPPSNTTAATDPVEIAAFLDTVTRAMESGASLGHALVHASDAHPALHDFAEPIALGCMRGLDMAAAIDDVATDRWTTNERHAAQALALASLDNAPHLTRHGATLIRERIAFEEERATRTAQALASLRILTRSPVVVAALILVMSADARRFLLTTPTGLGCLVVGVTAHVVGRRWMTRLIGATTA
jgi:Flp pilus assembly protein TadB